MGGHIDGVFASAPVAVKAYEQGHRGDQGIWVSGVPIEETYTATIQPLSEREVDNLMRAGVRLLDPRKVYINSGDLGKLVPVSDMDFLGQRWLVVKTDIRPWRTYAKVVVSRYDEQPT
jgi:hypothetical protein